MSARSVTGAVALNGQAERRRRAGPIRRLRARDSTKPIVANQEPINVPTPHKHMIVQKCTGLTARVAVRIKPPRSIDPVTPVTRPDAMRNMPIVTTTSPKRDTDKKNHLAPLSSGIVVVADDDFGFRGLREYVTECVAPQEVLLKGTVERRAQTACMLDKNLNGSGLLLSRKCSSRKRPESKGRSRKAPLSPRDV